MHFVVGQDSGFLQLVDCAIMSLRLAPVEFSRNLEVHSLNLRQRQPKNVGPSFALFLRNIMVEQCCRNGQWSHTTNAFLYLLAYYMDCMTKGHFSATEAHCTTDNARMRTIIIAYVSAIRGSLLTMLSYDYEQNFY